MSEVRDPTTVLPTIAYQLACFDGVFNSELTYVLANEYLHVSIGIFDTQFEQFILAAVDILQVVEIEDGVCGP